MKALVTIYGDRRKQILAGSTITADDLPPGSLPRLLENGSVELDAADMAAALSNATSNEVNATPPGKGAIAEPKENPESPIRPGLTEEADIVEFFNTASLEELQGIRGIAQKLAEAIITQRGIALFTSVEQLKKLIKTVDFDNLEFN